MRYIYGPVNSRRLGFSLGVSLAAYKICNFNCIYCQLGETTEFAQDRKVYAEKDAILEELVNWLQNNKEEAKQLNYITISGLGEPTLHIKIGEIITEIKKLGGHKVAVITNASLLNDPAVRQDLLQADLIVPSLDAVIPGIFDKITRPGKAVKVEEIIEALSVLRREFRGKIWLEVMLVKGINDDIRHIKRLKEAVDKINPDKVQINSPVRSTAQSGIFAVDKSKLKKIKEILGPTCEII